MGTVGYMSPEQVNGQTIDHRGDIFSFGIVLYELLSGKRAFERNTWAETVHAIVRDEPPALPATIPVGLRQIIARCLEKEPANRFQSAKDLGFALRTFSGVEGSGLEAMPDITTAPHAQHQWKFAALLAVLALSWAVWAGSRSKPASDTQQVHLALNPPRGNAFSDNDARSHRTAARSPLSLPDKVSNCFGSARLIRHRLENWLGRTRLCIRFGRRIRSRSDSSVMES